MDNEKLFELMTQMYAEMKEGFSGVDERFSAVDKRLDSIDKRFDGIDKRLDGIDKRFDGIDERLDAMDMKIGNVELDLKDFRKETMGRFNNLENKIDSLEAINASNHISIKNKLNKVSDDVGFLSHKEFQTEKDMYFIKQKLMDRKRKIK